MSVYRPWLVFTNFLDFLNFRIYRPFTCLSSSIYFNLVKFLFVMYCLIQFLLIPTWIFLKFQLHVSVHKSCFNWCINKRVNLSMFLKWSPRDQFCVLALPYASHYFDESLVKFHRFKLINILRILIMNFLYFLPFIFFKALGS